MSISDRYKKVCKCCNNAFEARRTNQEFCTKQCYIRFNNAKAKDKRDVTKLINKYLSDNRDLVKELVDNNTDEISKQELIKKKYNPLYFTHRLKLKDSDDYCLLFYDYGLIELENKNYKPFKHGNKS